MKESAVKKSWTGKLVGGLLGYWLIGNFWGGLLGLVLGHVYDQLRWLMRLGQHVLSGTQNTGWQHFVHFQRGSGQIQQQVQAQFTQSLFAVLGKLAKSDGRVSEAEIAWVETLMTRLKFSSERRQQAIQDFNRGKAEDFDLLAAIGPFARVANTFGLADIFIVILIECANSDGTIDRNEWSVIEEVAGLLGVNANVLKARTYGGRTHQSGYSAGRTRPNTADELNNAYRVLGVTHTATKAEIKKAYRKLMSQHHPDKLVSKGLPEEMMEMAKQKTQEIQAAYDLVSKSRV